MMDNRGFESPRAKMTAASTRTQHQSSIHRPSPTSIWEFPHDNNNEERLVDLDVLKCNIAQGDKKWPPTSKEDQVVDMSLNSVSMEDKKHADVLRILTRIIFMDIPLLFLLITFASICWVHYVHDEYLVKQIDAAEWTMERETTDMTYYYRTCNASDLLSTTNPLDLYLPNNATPDDAYQHQLKHGFTIFPNILSQETCSSLRQYIDSKNKKLTPDESIWLIEWENRWSFSLGTEEPSVAQAVMELTSNTLFKQTMTKILGDNNPAMIELTAITSGYGAKAQEFHHDGQTNLGQYGQSVAHAYSIFIQLQNTTKAGGATGVCPGLQYCADGLEQVCEEYGVYPVNANGHVAAGDALVMNMDSWHRGSAHTDPNEPDRVMLIVTFTSRPRERAESRLLPQGISYSLRWDLWGHTWEDLATANVTMKRPWTILRSLGLYKKPSADYGVDYVSSVSQRISNEYFGFTNEDLETFVRFGGFKFLPKWLQAKVEENTTWHDFLLDTFLLCKNFVTLVTMISAGVYILLCTITGMAITSKDPQTTIACRFTSTTLRLALMSGTVFALYKAAIQHVDNTLWAMDLRNDLRYTSPFGNSEVSDYDGILTIPHVNDVLIETRYKSRHLGMYNDYIGGLPGNRLWNALVDDKVTLYSSYSGLPSVLRDAISEYIISAVNDRAGRFLYQTRQGNWVELPHEDAVEITNLELKVKSNPVLTNVIEELDFLISEAKYGALRKTAMVKYDIFPYLLALKDLLLAAPERSVEKNVSIVRPVEEQNAKSSSRQFASVSSLSKPQTTEKLPSRPVALHVGELPGEPEPGAWLRQGDLVTVSREMEGKAPYLFKATLLYPLSTGDCLVKIHALDNIVVHDVECQDLTRYNPPAVGYLVHVKDDTTFVPGAIVKDHGDGLYDVQTSGGRLFENVSDDMFRRESMDVLE